VEKEATIKKDMKNTIEWKSLFHDFEKEANKYEALNRVRRFYEMQRTNILPGYHESVFKFIEENGAGSMNSEQRDKLYSPFEEQMDELDKWYYKTIDEICKYYSKQKN